jgi:hypothetical protein
VVARRQLAAAIADSVAGTDAYRVRVARTNAHSDRDANRAAANADSGTDGFEPTDDE